MNAVCLHRLALVVEGVEDGQGCAPINVGDKPILPRRQHNPAQRPLDLIYRSLRLTVFLHAIELEPFLEHADETLGWKFLVIHGEGIAAGCDEIARLAPCIVSFLHAHLGEEPKLHAVLDDLSVHACDRSTSTSCGPWR